jgi:hypothetical protein
MEWIFQKLDFVHCSKCGGKKWHEVGHNSGRKEEKKMCLKCYTVSTYIEGDNNESKSLL